MLKLGLTGGIGSGKSLVCEVFKRLGVPVYEADKEAKYLYDTDVHLRKQIIKLFGNKLYKNGLLDRKLLASIIFNDKNALKKVNAIVHPTVEHHFIQWALNQTAPYVIQEAAILFESGVARIMDKTITISAPEALRIHRTGMRDNVPVDEIKRRIANQITDEERNCLADFIIVSDDIKPILPQILHIHTTLIALSLSQ